MSMRWRERLIREVRDELDRFINFPVNGDLSLGSYGEYDGKACRFNWVGNIANLGIAFTEVGHQSVMAETYATVKTASVQGRLETNGNPFVNLQFKRSTAFALHAYKMGFDKIQLAHLQDMLNSKIKNGLKWDRKHVIVTEVWEAEGFTQVVAGDKEASIAIEATANGADVGFSIADPTIGLLVSSSSEICYQAIAQKHPRPYFGVHKLREVDNGQRWQLYKYGMRRDQ